MFQILEEREFKLLTLALNPAATLNESEVASIKLIRSLRCRGVEANAIMFPAESRGGSAGEIVINFGKYRGHQLKFVPLDYLDWLTKNVKDRPLLVQAVRRFLDEINRR
jgi:hypothetical protein